MEHYHVFANLFPTLDIFITATFFDAHKNMKANVYFFANKDLCPMKWSEPLIKWKMVKATLAILLILYFVV